MSEVRSYTIFKDSVTQKLKLKPSHWAPGYTPEYKATPQEALDYAFEKNFEKEKEVKDMHELLAKLQQELNAKEDHVFTMYGLEEYHIFETPKGEVFISWDKFNLYSNVNVNDIGDYLLKIAKANGISFTLSAVTSPLSQEDGITIEWKPANN